LCFLCARDEVRIPKLEMGKQESIIKKRTTAVNAASKASKRFAEVVEREFKLLNTATDDLKSSVATNNTLMDKFNLLNTVQIPYLPPVVQAVQQIQAAQVQTQAQTQPQQQARTPVITSVTPQNTYANPFNPHIQPMDLTPTGGYPPNSNS
jgi:hypothetical protein